MDEDLILSGSINKVEYILDELEYIGLDMKEKRNELNNLLKGKITLGDVQVEEDKLTKLNNFLSSLLPFSYLINIFRIAKYIKEAQNVHEKVDNSINLIGLLRENRLNLNEKTKLLSYSYQAIYETIKLEFKTNLDSKVFEMISDNPDDIKYIDALIENDIKDLKESSIINPEDFKRLTHEILKVKLKGLNPSLTTKEIILLIVVCTNKEQMKENTKKELETIKTKLIENEKYCEIPKVNYGPHISNSFKNNLLKLKENITDLTSCSKQMKTKIISFFLSTTLMTGAALATSPVSKLLSKDTYYPITEEILELIDGEYYRDTRYYNGPKINDEGIDRTLRLYSQILNKSTNKRRFTKYSLNDIIRKTDIEYINIDIDSPGVHNKIELNDIKDYTDESRYTVYDGPYRELIIRTQNLDESFENFNTNKYVVILGLIYLVLLLGLLLPFTPINSIKNFIKLRKIKNNIQNEININFHELEDYLDICLDKIEENAYLKERFNLIVSSGILDKDEEELIELINNELAKFEKDRETIYESSDLVLNLKKEFKK